METQVDLSKWSKCGPVYFREFPGGICGICRPRSDGCGYVGDAYSDDGFKGGYIEGYSAYVIKRLEEKYDPPPEPEVTKFDTVTVFKLNGRESFAYGCGPGESSWIAHYPLCVCKTREAAETAARNWLIEQARK